MEIDKTSGLYLHLLAWAAHCDLFNFSHQAPIIAKYSDIQYNMPIWPNSRQSLA